MWMNKGTDMSRRTEGARVLAAASLIVTSVLNVGCDTPKPPAKESQESQAKAAPASDDKSNAPAEPKKDEGDIPAPPDVAAAPEDAEKTASGIASKVLQKGTGTEHPNAWYSVTVHYTGWTTDGKMFDSSRKRGEPTSFSLEQVIPGWTEGLQLMVVGEQRRMWIPEALA